MPHLLMWVWRWLCRLRVLCVLMVVFPNVLSFRHEAPAPRERSLFATYDNRIVLIKGSWVMMSLEEGHSRTQCSEQNVLMGCAA